MGRVTPSPRTLIVDLPLHEDPSARFVPWMAGVMFYLALLLGLALTALWLVNKDPVQNPGALPTLTIEIPQKSPHQRRLIQSIVEQTIKDIPDVARVRVVSGSELETVFARFFEEKFPPEVRDALPLMVDVWIVKNPHQVAAKILGQMNQRWGDASILMHTTWTQELERWMHVGAALLSVGVVMFLCGIMAVVAFAVRTGVSIHGPILEILDLMGASERYIIRQFQRYTLHHLGRSLVLSAGLMVVTFLAIYGTLESLGFRLGLLDATFICFYMLFTCILLLTGAGLMLWMTHWVVKRSLRQRRA